MIDYDIYVSKDFDKAILMIYRFISGQDINKYCIVYIGETGITSTSRVKQIVRNDAYL